MKAKDVMVTDVITVRPETTVAEVARLLLEKRISGAPVCDGQGHLVGMVSEGDLLRRVEIGTERHRSWWLELLTPRETLGADFVKAHAGTVAGIMTREVISANENTDLGEIATLLERNRIKRVPILRDGKVVGIVSRANLVQALAMSAARGAAAERPESDRTIRERVMNHIRAQPWGMPWLLTVTVERGVVTLWGPIESEQARASIRVAAETTPGVVSVQDHLFHWQPANV